MQAMPPLKLIIPGNFYDVYIYSGKLYLWTLDGSIITFDWDQILDHLKEKIPYKLALECGFKNGDYLYGDYWNLFFRNSKILKVIQDDFRKLGARHIELPLKKFEGSAIEQNNPFISQHSSMIIYNNKIYLTCRHGVFYTELNKSKKKYPINTRVCKLNDLPAISISAKYSSLCLSAGNDGLFDYSLDKYYSEEEHDLDFYFNTEEKCKVDKNLAHISDEYSSFSRWANYSIFSSSYYGSGFLADFKISKSTEINHTSNRSFDKITTGATLFKNDYFSWGVQDKICQIEKEGNIKIIKFNPWQEDETNKRFVFLEDVKLPLNGEQNKLGEFVSADSSVFGYILEYDNGILVIDSIQQLHFLWGEPISWRVYPNANYYKNHLHVIYDDRVEILSFNNDYFVDQKQKNIGIQYNKQTKNKKNHF